MRHTSFALVTLGMLFLSATSGSTAPEKAPASHGAKSASWDLALAPQGEPGRPFVLEGRLLSLPDSLPIRNASIYAYHADANGEYSKQGEDHPRLAGTVHTNIVGDFRIRTILPGLAEGIPHVHLVVSGQGRGRQMKTLNLC